MKSQKDNLFQNLPGWELVSAGIRDISQGKYNTVSALLVFMASPRLRFLGFNIPNYPADISAEKVNQRLYQLLEKNTSDAYSQYNALRRRLVSFCKAMESR